MKATLSNITTSNQGPTVYTAEFSNVLFGTVITAPIGLSFTAGPTVVSNVGGVIDATATVT